jgi:hypothetical protein
VLFSKALHYNSIPSNITSFFDIIRLEKGVVLPKALAAKVNVMNKALLYTSRQVLTS